MYACRHRRRRHPVLSRLSPFFSGTGVELLFRAPLPPDMEGLTRRCWVVFMPFLKLRMPQTRTVPGFRLGPDLPTWRFLCSHDSISFLLRYRRRAAIPRAVASGYGRSAASPMAGPRTRWGQSINQSKALTKSHAGTGEAASQHHHRGQQTRLGQRLQKCARDEPLQTPKGERRGGQLQISKFLLAG